MATSASKPDLHSTSPILSQLSELGNIGLQNLELDIIDGELVLKAGVSYGLKTSTQLEKIQLIADKIKRLCSEISFKKASNDPLNYRRIKSNLTYLRIRLMNRIDVLERSTNLFDIFSKRIAPSDFEKTFSNLRNMEISFDLPPGINRGMTFVPAMDDCEEARPTTPPLDAPIRGETSITGSSMAFRRVSARHFFPRTEPMEAFVPPDDPVLPNKEAFEVPTKESLTNEIYHAFQNQENGEMLSSSFRSTELKSIKSKGFLSAVDGNNIDYIQELYDEETDRTLRDALHHLLFKLLFPGTQ